MKIPTIALVLLSTGLGSRAQAPDEQKAAAEAMHLIGAEIMGNGRVVADKPFSGDMTTETVQPLPDGNRIVRQNLTRYYRDRSGRTRREQIIESLGASVPLVPVRIIIISDPVAGTEYILDAQGKNTLKSGRTGKEPAKTAAAPEAGAEKSLGTRTIEGLECNGTSRTITIPAGRLGNRMPIAITAESWFAPAIEAVVRSTTSDPRFGVTTFTLHNVVLGNQPPELFQPPGNRIDVRNKPTSRPEKESKTP